MSRSPRLTLLFVPLFALATYGCKKDSAVQESLDLIDKHGKEIDTKITSAADKKAGVTDAQQYFDSNKDDLTTRVKELSELRGFQVSEEMQSKMASTLIDAAFMCGKIQVDLMAATIQDPDLEKSLEKLCNDWEAALTL